MSEAIGILWQDGENLVKGGEPLEALLLFQRAKGMLIAESKSVYSNATSSDNRMSKLMGEIMQKLTESIDKVIVTLQKNPVLSLGLRRGFTKKDVKKAYRKCALKYHPDKNTDCDTSIIFTCVQAAYEKLLAAAPSDFEPMSPQPTPRNTGTKQENQNHHHSSQSQQQPPAEQSAYTFQHQRSQRASAAASNDGSTSTANKEQKKPSSEPRYKSGEANDPGLPFDMSTDMLRSLLRQFGFSDRVDEMSRPELVRKYLAVTAHLSAQERERDKAKQQQHKQQQDSCNNNSGTTGAAAADADNNDAAAAAAASASYHSAFYKESSSSRNDTKSSAKQGGNGVDKGPQQQQQQQQQRRNSSSMGGSGYGGGSSEAATADIAAHWLNQWNTRMAAERQKEKDRENDKEKDRDRIRRERRGNDNENDTLNDNSHHHHRGEQRRPFDADEFFRANVPDKGGAAAVETDPRAIAADEARRQRVTALVAQLPTMTVNDLRRLMALSGVSSAGCVEKADLLERLYVHFGIRSSSSAGAAGTGGGGRYFSSFGDGNNKEDTSRSSGAHVKKTQRSASTDYYAAAAAATSALASSSGAGTGVGGVSLTPAEAAIKARMNLRRRPLHDFKDSDSDKGVGGYSFSESDRQHRDTSETAGGGGTGGKGSSGNSRDTTGKGTSSCGLRKEGGRETTAAPTTTTNKATTAISTDKKSNSSSSSKGGGADSSSYKNKNSDKPQQQQPPSSSFSSYQRTTAREGSFLGSHIGAPPQVPAPLLPNTNNTNNTNNRQRSNRTPAMDANNGTTAAGAGGSRERGGEGYAAAAAASKNAVPTQHSAAGGGAVGMTKERLKEIEQKLLGRVNRRPESAPKRPPSATIVPYVFPTAAADKSGSNYHHHHHHHHQQEYEADIKYAAAAVAAASTANHNGNMEQPSIETSKSKKEARDAVKRNRPPAVVPSNDNIFKDRDDWRVDNDDNSNDDDENDDHETLYDGDDHGVGNGDNRSSNSGFDNFYGSYVKAGYAAASSTVTAAVTGTATTAAAAASRTGGGLHIDIDTDRLGPGTSEVEGGGGEGRGGRGGGGGGGGGGYVPSTGPKSIGRGDNHSTRKPSAADDTIRKPSAETTPSNFNPLLAPSSGIIHFGANITGMDDEDDEEEDDDDEDGDVDGINDDHSDDGSDDGFIDKFSRFGQIQASMLRQLNDHNNNNNNNDKQAVVASETDEENHFEMKAMRRRGQDEGKSEDLLGGNQKDIITGSLLPAAAIAAAAAVAVEGSPHKVHHRDIQDTSLREGERSPPKPKTDWVGDPHTNLQAPPIPQSPTKNKLSSPVKLTPLGTSTVLSAAAGSAGIRVGVSMLSDTDDSSIDDDDDDDNEFLRRHGISGVNATHILPATAAAASVVAAAAATESPSHNTGGNNQHDRQPEVSTKNSSNNPPSKLNGDDDTNTMRFSMSSSAWMDNGAGAMKKANTNTTDSRTAALDLPWDDGDDGDDGEDGDDHELEQSASSYYDHQPRTGSISSLLLAGNSSPQHQRLESSSSRLLAAPATATTATATTTVNTAAKVPVVVMSYDNNDSDISHMVGYVTIPAQAGGGKVEGGVGGGGVQTAGRGSSFVGRMRHRAASTVDSFDPPSTVATDTEVIITSGSSIVATRDEDNAFPQLIEGRAAVRVATVSQHDLKLPLPALLNSQHDLLSINNSISSSSSNPQNTVAHVQQRRPEDAMTLQEEVDFWVNSARDDRSAGATFQSAIDAYDRAISREGGSRGGGRGDVVPLVYRGGGGGGGGGLSARRGSTTVPVVTSATTATATATTTTTTIAAASKQSRPEVTQAMKGDGRTGTMTDDSNAPQSPTERTPRVEAASDGDRHRDAYDYKKDQKKSGGDSESWYWGRT